MKKILITILVIAGVVLLTGFKLSNSLDNSKLEVFKPWLYNPDLAKKQDGHKYKMEYTAVLVFYRSSVQYDINRNIRLDIKTLKDTHFLYNVINKAHDSTWLNRHIYLSSDSTKYAY